MNQALIPVGFDSRFWPIVLLVAALASVGCNNDVNITGPEFPTLTPQWQTFQIVGTMTAEEGWIQEATILYDGIELVGARAVCVDNDGCRQLQLRATSIGATAGRHTIAFQVLRQSRNRIDYSVEGEVLAELGPADHIVLGPVQRTLEAGQSVTFEFDHLP